MMYSSGAHKKDKVGADINSNGSIIASSTVTAATDMDYRLDGDVDDETQIMIDMTNARQLESFDIDSQQKEKRHPPSVAASSSSAERQDSTKIMMVIAFYFIISISLVFLNKMLMKNLDFDYPLFITWYQQIVSFVMIYVICKVAPGINGLSFLPPFEFKQDVAQRVLPLTIVLTLMIAFNNLCLEYVEVARSLTICFSIILTYIILNSRTSYKATMACAIVFFGFIMGSAGEVNFSWHGVIFGLLSSFFVALYSIYVKRILPICDGNEWKLSIYNTAISIALLFPLIIVSGESKTLFEQDILYTGWFWFVMTVTGAMGYLISIAIFMQIKYTSPLTNAISGTVKACIQTVLSVMIWGNEITFQNAFGILLVILGSFYYSYVRYQEMLKK